MGAILTFFAPLFSFFVGLPAWIISVLAVVFLSFFDFGKDFLCWIFENILDLVIYILNGFNFDFSSFGVSALFGSLPPDLVALMAYIKFPQAVGMIITALGIRVLLQLIPFVRLGS